MAILDIITVPHPILEMPARPVDPDEFGPELARLVKDMAETMYAAPGVGLAAPQVSDPRRIIVVDPGEKDERGRLPLRKKSQPPDRTLLGTPCYWQARDLAQLKQHVVIG